MLEVFSTSIYDLLNPGFMLSFVSTIFAFTFETPLQVLLDPIIVITPLGENVRADRVHKDYPIVVCGKTVCRPC